jgi:hypothetical protein
LVLVLFLPQRRGGKTIHPPGKAKEILGYFNKLIIPFPVKGG